MNKTNITLKQGMIALVITVAALIVGFGLPSWQFLITVALAKGLVALGVGALAALRPGLFWSRLVLLHRRLWCRYGHELPGLA